MENRESSSIAELQEQFSHLKTLHLSQVKQIALIRDQTIEANSKLQESLEKNKSDVPSMFQEMGRVIVDPYNSIPTTLKMDMPYFNEDDPQSWLFKTRRYFLCYKTPEDQKLLLATWTSPTICFN